MGRPPLTTQELHSRAKRSTCVIPLRLLGLRQREGAQQEPKAWDSPVPPATHLGLLWRDPDRGDKEAKTQELPWPYGPFLLMSRVIIAGVSPLQPREPSPWPLAGSNAGGVGAPTPHAPSVEKLDS
jgi:hypothetical protein